MNLLAIIEHHSLNSNAYRNHDDMKGTYLKKKRSYEIPITELTLNMI